MDSLTVWSVFWGKKYDKGYVYALKDMVSKYLNIEHDFRCITVENLPGITTIKPFVPYPGWWQKIGLFAPTIAIGPSIYLDLDVVITGDITFLADYTDKFSAAANWAESGHGGIQSSVMCWPGNWHEPFYRIKPLWANRRDHDSGYTELGGKMFWGDQEFLYDILGEDWRRLPGVCSYKYHGWMKGKPDEPIIVFHGNPKPHEVYDRWILPYTLVHEHVTSKNTRDGLSVQSLIYR